MIGYASRTGTKRNLLGLQAAGWRLMVSAKGVLRTEGFRYALDNGAWWAHANDQPFDADAFLRAYDALAEAADFVVLPDVVAGGMRSLAVSVDWIDRLRSPPCRLYLAVQDGMELSEVETLVCRHRLGVFLGGSTEWKLQTMGSWGRLARAWEVPFHVGRVNTARRIRLCAAAGATSFDGSGPSRFAKILPKLDHARRQPDIFAP